VGLSLTTPPPHHRRSAQPSPVRRLLLVLSLVRYRFFLYAGLLPYLLGAAWAWGVAHRLLWASSSLPLMESM